MWGNVPSCLGDVTSLREVYLGSNNFTATIPSSLWNLKDILMLNLSSNFFNGSLPLEVGNLKAAILLDLLAALLLSITAAHLFTTVWRQLSVDIFQQLWMMKTFVTLCFQHQWLHSYMKARLLRSRFGYKSQRYFICKHTSTAFQ
ncbi:hypothetical protein CQW23_04250 [Capsicum baccatum]|uniref:LRR receptor-like serine/threonine-protein kinase n=1 Tax=Capsicum baccatum TaxID=33114 RepID=A0A2G2XE49_CAPBA|nr:hypothetical protein CQW23_04250 [Capsicum baccatum]